MFTKGHQPAHKGKMTTTDPVKTLADMAKVKEVIGNDIRLQALWATATATALRVGDLVKLTWDDAQDDGTTITFTVLEGKTKKRRIIPMSVGASALLRKWRGICEHTHIFSGQRGTLSTATWSRIVKDLCERAGLVGSFASHTCRKSHVRIQLDEYKTPLYVMMNVLGHSHELQTMTYVGKLHTDVAKAYANEI